MSDLSNKKAPTVTEPLGGAASLGAQVDSKVKPVTIWAAIGGATPGAPAVCVDPVDHRALLHAGAGRPDRSADVHEGLPHVQRRS